MTKKIKILERESAEERLFIFRLWAPSTRSVIISQFGVFWMDRYRAGRPRAKRLWYTMEIVYYSDCACLCDVYVSGVVFGRARAKGRDSENKRSEGVSENEWEEKQRCTFWVFLQERLGGKKETILTHCWLGLHSQPFLSSARRQSDLLVHLQNGDEQLPSASAQQPLNALTRPRKKTRPLDSSRLLMCLCE